MKLSSFSFLTASFLACILTFTSVQGENILFFWGVSGYSHRISVWPLIEKLAERGHKITFISPYPAKVASSNPNITDIVPKNLASDVGLVNIDFVTLRLQGGVKAIDGLWEEYYQSGIKGCRSMMKNPEVINWIEHSSFDLVVLDALYNECGYAIVHKFKIPHIMYSPTSHFQWWKDSFGLPDENFPEMENHYSRDMTFFQSVKNILTPLYWKYQRQTKMFPLLESMIKEGLNLSDLPSLHEMEKNTSFIFTNTHFSEEYPRSLPPYVVDIGGIHCHDKRKPLPKDVLDFLNSAGDEGVVFLSFGTYASLASLPKYLQNIFFNAMSKVTVKFLVKYDQEVPKNLPKNVKTVQWISQQDVLAHPKVKLYIGHGGLLGTQEGIYHSVPMIVIPLFAEQDFNAVRAHERETAIALEISELTQDKLVDAIWTVLNNTKYAENTRKLSRLFKDRPSKPLDTALYWVEYVLRHKGDTAHLRPYLINKTWYERRMLHIWAFIALITISSLALMGSILYILIKAFIFSSSKKSKTE